MQLSRQSPECDDAVTVTVEGDITAVKLSPFSEPLADLLGSTAYSQRVLLDLSSATAIDSSGIHWLLKLHQQCESSQGRLVLQGVSPTIRSVLRILRLQTLFEIAGDEPLEGQRQTQAAV